MWLKNLFRKQRYCRDCGKPANTRSLGFHSGTETKYALCMACLFEEMGLSPDQKAETLRLLEENSVSRKEQRGE